MKIRPIFKTIDIFSFIQFLSRQTNYIIKFFLLKVLYLVYYLSYYLLAPTMLAAQLAVRFASAVVFSGVIAKLACDGLARTGVLRSYAVGARLAPVSIDDEEE